MKKILSTVAALGLVAGFAATASALDIPQNAPATGLEKAAKPTAAGVDLFSVHGEYAIAGAYLNQHNGAYYSDYDYDGAKLTSYNGTCTGSYCDESSAAWWMHTFKTTSTLRVNDKVSVVGEIRFADRDIFGASISDTSDADTAMDGGRRIDAHKIYMEYLSPVGKIRVGRVPTAAWYGKFLNNASQGDRIMWWPSFVSEPWSLLFFTQKVAENDLFSASESDADFDVYFTHLQHKGDMGTTAVSYNYWRNAGNTNQDVYGWSELWGYGNYQMDNFSLEAELAYAFGDANATQDLNAFAGMVDAGMNFGNLDVGLLYFYVSGDDNTASDTDVDNYFGGPANGAHGVGKDFNPYQILSGDYMGILQDDKVGNGEGFNTIMTKDNKVAGVQSLGVHANMKVNDKLTVRGAIGTAWALETAAGTDDSYGWEFDLGASYKLLSNLTYSAHFGYLSTGDFFEDTASNIGTEDVYLLAHQLTMKF